MNEMDEPGHFTQFYEEDAFLLDTVAKFIGGSLEANGGGVVIATRPHSDGIEKRLNARGLDLAAAREQGQYVTLEAGETCRCSWTQRRRTRSVSPMSLVAF